MIKRKLIVLIIIALFIVILPQTVFANAIDFNDVNTWKFNLDQPVPKTLSSIAGAVIKTLKNISIIVTVIVISLLGVRYMFESVENRAGDRRRYMNIIIGVVFITLVTNIIAIIFDVAESVLS